MGKKKTAISDEEIIAALLASKTIGEAAETCGLSTRAMYDRMQADEFQISYQAAKTETVRAAVNRINAQMGEAIDIIAEIMENKEANPATRLQAAQTILNNAGKMSERLDLGETKTKQKAKTAETNRLFAIDGLSF